MPVIGAAAAMRRIQFEDDASAGERRYGRMRDQLTERSRECFVFGVVEVILVAEEYNLITKQGIADGVQDFRRQPPRQSHARDFSADPTGDRIHAKLGSSQ